MIGRISDDKNTLDRHHPDVHPPERVLGRRQIQTLERLLLRLDLGVVHLDSTERIARHDLDQRADVLNLLPAVDPHRPHRVVVAGRASLALADATHVVHLLQIDDRLPSTLVALDTQLLQLVTVEFGVLRRRRDHHVAERADNGERRRTHLLVDRKILVNIQMPFASARCLSIP